MELHKLYQRKQGNRGVALKNFVCCLRMYHSGQYPLGKPDRPGIDQLKPIRRTDL
jgi:hypothetical protein